MLFVGTLVFLMLQYLRPQEWVPFIYGWPVVRVGMVVLLPAWFFTLGGRKILRTSTDLFMLFYWLVCVMSHLRTPPQMLDTAWNFGKVFICYLLVSHTVNTRRRLLVALIVISVMLSVVAMMGELRETKRGLFMYASKGTFDNRNDFAHGIALMLPLAAAFVIRGTPFLKIAGAGLAAIVVPELVRSESRGGMLAAMFAVYAVAFVAVRSRRARKVMLVIGVIGAIAVLGMSARLGTITDFRSDESAMSRIAIWRYALQSFRASPVNPIIGRGYQEITRGMWRSKAAHSSYMNNLYELGAPGLFVLIGVLFFAARDAYRLATTAAHRTTRTAALGLTGMAAGIILGSAFESLSYRIYVLVPIALMSALRVVEHNERLASLSPDAPQGHAPRQAMPAPAPEAVAPGSGPLLTVRDFWLVAGLTFACWLSYTILVTVA